ncbi:hypothetical protein F5884DRAFT_772921 [Xylogone sp. PMI_703]|nr:hypothetical protein F5884DRAFT_772921 [Xylogone sp. PMI_703]
MLTDRIRLAGPETTEPEDYLSSSLAVIFPDDIVNQHGDRDSGGVIYTSTRFGEIGLSLADPEGETSRRLFSHFLWNAGVQVAVFLEGEEEDVGVGDQQDHGKAEKGEKNGVLPLLPLPPKQPSEPVWDVQGLDVLELGAGTGLAGIIAALMGARRVVISDYPAPEVLENLRANVSRNVDSRKQKQLSGNGTNQPESGALRPRRLIAETTVQGHEWGVLTDGFSVRNHECFDRLLVADCLWMPWQHANLLASIRWFLKEDGKAWVVAGFHTGREKMAGFFAEEMLEKAGLEIERIWERNAEGEEREWEVDRGVEDITARKRWLVVAVLRRRREQRNDKTA